MKNTLRQYFVASLPAAFVGVGNLGDRLQKESAEAAGIWQLGLFDSLQLSSGAAGNLLVSVALGASFFLPLLITVSVTSRAWAEIFSRTRGRGVDPGWFLSAWLYVLLLPATVPLHYAALGFSFGAVFGCYVFGGTGRYIVNPALLGVAFLSISYPDLFAQNHWLPGSDALSSWKLVATEGIEAAAAGGTSWTAPFLGREIGALGTSSALAALLGASYLIARRVASAGIVAGALVGLLLTAELFGEIPSLWHLALGNFAFVLAFIATDRTTQPCTTVGCWAYGVLFGVLIIILRVADPARPEATVSALLLASLCVPLIDHIAHATPLGAKAPQDVGHE
ncbi:MAG TPA: RnfABCDGE type electron transport complex subunit D [Gammaproteobacteria bacterium]